MSHHAIRLLKISLGLALLVVFNASPALPEPDEELKALRKELDAVKETQTAIQKELQEIRALLRGAQGPPPAETRDVILSVDDDPFKGDKNAPLTLVEFSDYQCPFCARHIREALPAIEREYIQTGKLRYVFRDFPIEAIHREAFKAAEAANCAGEQDKYWEMHDRLFANQRALGLKDLGDHARALGLDMATFHRCLSSGKQATEIRKDIADGLRAGVRGTPTFFLGLTEPNDSKVKALRVIRGAQPYTRFKEAIDSLLPSQRK